MSEEASYYLRFISFFIDVGTETALQVVNYCTKDGVESHLNSRKTRDILQQLLKKKVLTKTQFNHATAPVPNPNNFDISLLTTILCNTVLLPPPNQGWENRPSERDLSLSADILRLRNIRNSVVAHRSRAALPKYKFDRLWKELEEILLRITVVTAPDKKEELISKIEYYSSTNLDAQNDQKYLQKLEEWWENCEEVSKLQEKVEELVQKCNEFALFFRDIPEEYSCYERLLFKGGRLVLSNLLMKQISEQGLDLRDILLKNRDVLEHLNQEMPKPLFHTDSSDKVLVNTVTDSWDIFVLACVIETILKPKEMKVIKMIKDARINYAETALMSIHNRSRFSVCYGNLVYAIRMLSQSLDEDIQEKCDKLISTTDVTVDDYLGQLKSNGLEIKNLSDLYKENLEKLKTSMNEMEDAGICFKNDHVLDLKMITLGENAEKKRVAEDTLYTVWQAALKMSENPDEFGAVRIVVDRILEDIRNISDVKAAGIRRGCLLFSLRCCSCHSLVQIIEYLSSEMFEEHMDNLSRELGYISDAVIRIEGRITFESLHKSLENPQNCSKAEDKGLHLPIICSSPKGMRDVFKLLGNEKTRNNINEISDENCSKVDDKGLNLPIICSSPEGMRDVFKLLGKEETRNSINQISDGLSAQVGETISVELLHDPKGFSGVFDNTDMAVSGRKLPTIFGLISNGSSEKFDHSCRQCLTIDQHKEAHGFCLDCKEYLCKNCFTSHQRTKELKHHQLLDKSNVDKQGIPKTHLEVCTEKCLVHKNEVIKYFCQQHKELCCHDCVYLSHSTCKLEYIPDKCAGIGDSEEYRSLSELLDQKLDEVNTLIKKATERVKEIDTCHESLIKEIDQFQKEVNDRIQQIRNGIQAEVEKKKSSDKQIVQDVLDTSTKVSTYISKLQSSLQDNKTTKQNGQLYIAIKQAMSKLKSDEIKISEDVLQKTDMQYSFEPNQDLQKMLSKQEVFGKLWLSTSLDTPSKKLGSLIHKEDINIKTKSDMDICIISGCAVLSCNKLVLADYFNNKLKVLDTQSKLVVEEKKLKSKPWDITKLSQDQIAVTMPAKRKILIIKSGRKLSTVNRIPVKGWCWGITFHQDQLYVLCKYPNNVVILDTKGNVHNTISLNNDVVEVPPCYIVVSEDSKLIYINDPDSGRIVSITLQGLASAAYKGLPTPYGMLVLDDGSLLVCCYDDTIHQISGDLKQSQKIVGGLGNPWSICYNHHQREVYIGGWACNQLKVFSVK